MGRCCICSRAADWRSDLYEWSPVPNESWESHPAGITLRQIVLPRRVFASMNLERFQFGDFEFDAEARVLTHKGRRVRLQAQPAQLLGVLLARRDCTVSREELKQAIWGNSTHVDFEKGLNFCISQVRAALGDDASRSLYIQTVPKKGYRFIAPVTVLSGTAGAAPSSDAVHPLRRSWLRPLAAAVGATALALGLLSFYLRTRHLSVPNLAVVRFDAGKNRPDLQGMADELTDDVTVRLTSANDGHYRVIGNASILRVPREQRDLRSIESSLGCRYAVLGQVEGDGDRILILAHLIRLSDLTHVWVVRYERKTDDPSSLESQVAEQIASQFAAVMAGHPDSAASFGAGNR